jgi:hypothetical protein
MSQITSSLLNEKLKGLSADERRIALEILSDLSKGNDHSLRSLINADYREVPVSPEKFLEDPYYFNHIGKDVYPAWKKHFCEIYAAGNYVFHVILTGSIGCGKDFFTQLCLSYELYKIGCLKNPHEYYKMSVNSDIVIALVSVTKAQTKAVLFNGFKRMIDQSPWFQEHFCRDLDKNDIIEINSPADNGENAKMGKIVVMYGAPNNTTVIGANVITAVIDEANFMEVVQKSKKSRGVNKEFNQAKSLYNNIYKRMDSRFHEEGGKLAGKLFVLSSRQYPDDFLEEKIRQIRGREGVVIYEYTKYQVAPWLFSEETFDLELGNERFPPRILNEGDTPRPDAEVIKIPIDLRQHFEDDIDMAIRDIAGRATLSVKNFLGQRDKLYKCISSEVPCFYSGQVTTLEDGHCILEDALHKIDRTAPRAIHLDLSRSEDSTGVAMVHVSGIKKVQHSIITMVDGVEMHSVVDEWLPVFRADLILEVVAPVNGVISQAKIRALIIKLRNAGFNIVVVSADDYQSDATLETLASNGFNVRKQSVDRSLDPYYNLREAIYEGRFEFYQHDKFIKEMISLEEDTKKRKIDHLPTGSKDCSDAVAGAIQNLIDLGIMSSNTLTKEAPSLGLSVESSYEATKEDFEEEFDNEVFTNIFKRDLEIERI